MKRYFFNVIDGKFIVDTEGVMLADITAVRAKAITTADEILRDNRHTNWPGNQWQMHVTNESKETVFKLSFSAAEPSRAP